MDKLYSRHDSYMSDVPMEYVREVSSKIDWNSRLIMIKGQKGVGKSTIMQQYIKRNYSPYDRHVLYCSADSSYFADHTLIDTADKFEMNGGTHLFIDEIHKYPNWSREVKEMYDAHKNLRIVLSGSSLIKLNDGDADLSRRMVSYLVPGLSFREYLLFESGIRIRSVSLDELLESPERFCSEVKVECHPLEHFRSYLESGYYPYYFENRKTYPVLVENVLDYIVNNELTSQRGLETGNCRKVKALIRVLSRMFPYEVDISKLSRCIGIQRLTLLKYMKDLEEAKLITRLFQNLDSVTDLQKPGKIYLDNTNLIFVLSDGAPQTGTLRECFFCNQLISSGHEVEYGGLLSGDFRIDGKTVIELGGPDKVKSEENAYVAADGIETPVFRKIPLWAFGFLY